MSREVRRRDPFSCGSSSRSRHGEVLGVRRALLLLLFAVLDVYGKLFDRVLYMRGTSREELAERLAGAAAHGG